MITYHPDTRDHTKEEMYYRFFRSGETKDIDLMASIISKYTNSPIVWKDGRRSKTNFLKCDWIALDFDNGIFIKDIIDALKDTKHIIGTTRNHQISKENELPWDRFRVWIKLEKEITSLVEYEECVKFYAIKFGSDIAATDGARKFRPCKEIVSINKEGKEVEVKRIEINTKPVNYTRFSAEKQTMPVFIKNYLTYGTSGESRNRVCFKCGLHLSRSGYSIDQIIDMIMSSPIPINQSNTVRNEVRSAVINGSKYTG